MDDVFRSELRATILQVGKPLGVTNTEAEVLSFVAAGWTNESIAAVRRVSSETIKTEVASGLQRFGLHRRGELLPQVLRLTRRGSRPP